MVKHSIDFDLIDDGRSTILLRVCCFLCECFDSELLAISQSLSEVDGREVSLAYLSHGLEQIVEASLIDLLSQLSFPFLEIRDAIAVQLKHFETICLET